MKYNRQRLLNSISGATLSSNGYNMDDIKEFIECINKNNHLSLSQSGKSRIELQDILHIIMLDDKINKNMCMDDTKLTASSASSASRASSPTSSSTRKKFTATCDLFPYTDRYCMKIIERGGGGDCFYYCFANALHKLKITQDLMSPHQLRVILTNVIDTLPNSVVKLYYVTEKGIHNKVTLKQYLLSRKSDADNVSISILSDYFKMATYIYDRNKKIIYCLGCSQPKNIYFCLLYYTGAHYQQIIVYDKHTNTEIISYGKYSDLTEKENDFMLYLGMVDIIY